MQPNYPGYSPFPQSNIPNLPIPPPFPVPSLQQPNFPLPVPVIPQSLFPSPASPPNPQVSGISNFPQIPLPPSSNMPFYLNQVPIPSNIPVTPIPNPNLISNVANYNQGVISVSNSESSYPINASQPMMIPQAYPPQNMNPNNFPSPPIPNFNPLPQSMYIPGNQYGVNIPQPVFPNFQTPPNSSKEFIECPDYTMRIIESKNYHQEIATKYQSCSIKILGTAIEVTALNKDIQLIKNELDTLIKRFTFDANPTWNCLQNNGRYQPYDSACAQIIENAYRTNYPKLMESTYKNYSVGVEITAAKVKYFVQFAKIGGVHRQVRKQANNTIRAVKRVANGVDLNIDFLLTYTWCWLHDSGEYSTYEDDAMFLIEESYIEYKNGQGGQSIALIQGSNGTTYKIDFATMTQYNEINQTPRQVIRVDLA